MRVVESEDDRQRVVLARRRRDELEHLGVFEGLALLHQYVAGAEDQYGVPGSSTAASRWFAAGTGGKVRSFSMIAGPPALAVAFKVNWDSFRKRDARPSRFVSKSCSSAG